MDHHGAGHNETQSGHAHRAHGSHTAAQQVGHHGTHGSGHEAHAGHDKHAGHSVAMFRDKFWITLILTIPTLVWGHMLQNLLGYSPPEFTGSWWIAPAFGTAVFLYGGQPFLVGALRELRSKLPGMMTLIALAIAVAFVFSSMVTLGYPGMPLWEELATLVAIMLLGHWMEMRSITQAQGAVAELAKLLPAVATRILSQGAGGQERLEEVPLSQLAEGDLILVRPGAGVAADGVVRSGKSEVNESMLTGESRLMEKHEGDEVIAGTVNGTGSLRVGVTRTGEQTMLAGIMRLVEQAQASQSRAQALADRAAFWLTMVAVGSGAVTLITWLSLGASSSYAVNRTVTVLVIACPHALGLAVPLVIAISTTIGARNGLLVRNRRGLEDARLVNAVVFDKTGTLTLGSHELTTARAARGIDEAEILRLAAAVERDAEHPIGKAIVAKALERALTIPVASEFESMAGLGVRARVEGRRLAVGGPNLSRESGVTLPPELEVVTREAAERGQSAVYLLEDDRVLGIFTVGDAVRPESREAIDRLHALGVDVSMLTGDAESVAQAVGRELGIDSIFAQVLPAEKSARIQELQKTGKRVAMVGDGVNDAPALVTADLGIAIGAGTHVAVEAGDVVLVRSDPRDVPKVIALSRETYRKMVQNLWWAAGYNIVAIPLAAGVLAPVGLVLSPAAGAVLMSLSTIIVALNAQILKRARI